MTKKFICVQGSPEIPKGAIAHYVETQNKYFVWQHEPLFIGNTPVGSVPVEYSASFLPWQIEGNDCWEEVKEEPAGRWRPEHGTFYYYINYHNSILSHMWSSDDTDNALLEACNVFRTMEEAGDEVKRRNSIANAWIPKGNEHCYIWDFTAGGVVFGRSTPVPHIYIGACHKTEEACEAWGKEYAHLFDKRPKHD